VPQTHCISVRVLPESGTASEFLKRLDPDKLKVAFVLQVIFCSDVNGLRGSIIHEHTGYLP
jgi:hypothetical protein